MGRNCQELKAIRMKILDSGPEVSQKAGGKFSLF